MKVGYQSITDLKIKKQPPQDELGFELFRQGEIHVTFKTHPRSACMMAAGPHRGQLLLEKGFSLPKLQKGSSYRVWINGEEVLDSLEVE